MIKIRHHELTAVFNSQRTLWDSNDKEFQGILNDHLPDFCVGDSFRADKNYHGLDSIALHSASKLLKKEIEILEYTPDSIPEDDVIV